MPTRADGFLSGVLRTLQGKGGCIVGESMAFADAEVEAATVYVAAGTVAWAVTMGDALVAGVGGEGFGVVRRGHVLQ